MNWLFLLCDIYILDNNFSKNVQCFFRPNFENKIRFPLFVYKKIWLVVYPCFFWSFVWALKNVLVFFKKKVGQKILLVLCAWFFCFLSESGNMSGSLWSLTPVFLSLLRHFKLRPSFSKKNTRTIFWHLLHMVLGLIWRIGFESQLNKRLSGFCSQKDLKSVVHRESSEFFLKKILDTTHKF